MFCFPGSFLFVCRVGTNGWRCRGDLLPRRRSLLTRRLRWVFTSLSFPVSSLEKLCAVDLSSSDSPSQLDRMALVLSSCKQIQEAGYLSSILNSQVFNPFSAGTRSLPISFSVRIFLFPFRL